MALTYTFSRLVAYLRRTGWTYDDKTLLWRHPDTNEVVCADSSTDLGRGRTRESILGALGRLKARDPSGPPLPEEELQ